MEDRFRVRVWDIYGKRYMYEYQSNPDYAEIIDDPNYIFEQCTGLKDKYGNLIYEGDIVCDNEYHLEVKEQNGGFIVTNGAVDEMLYLDLKEYEIIGTIHEDPELLEVK